MTTQAQALNRISEVLEQDRREQRDMQSRRCVAAGRLVGTANYLRNNPPETLSPAMKDYLLESIVVYADEFLGVQTLRKGA